MTEEKPVMRVREQNRMLIIPEAFYAGGLYRTPFDVAVKEWERTYYLRVSDVEKLQEK